MRPHVLLRRLMEFDARLDVQIFGVEKSQMSKTQAPKEFALFPAVAGGLVGSGIGAALSKKRQRPDGSWVDANGQPTSAPVAAPLTGAVVGAGAGVGASKLHSSVMSGYGGEGGVKEAYGNLGRNVVQGVKTGVADRMAAASAGAAAGRVTGTNIGMKAGAGIANVLDKLRKLKGAGVGALGKVFAETRMPRELVEFEDRLDDILFADKKSLAPSYEPGWVEADNWVAPRRVTPIRSKEHWDKVWNSDDRFAYHPEKSRVRVPATVAGVAGAIGAHALIKHRGGYHKIAKDLGNVARSGARSVGKHLANLSTTIKPHEFAIDLNPANKGKFTATMKKSGKSAKELLHSKNPLTRKRANFALVSKKWRKGKRFDRNPSRTGGIVEFDNVRPSSGKGKVAAAGIAGLALGSAARLPSRARLMALSAKHGLRTGWAARGLAEKFRRAL